MPEFKLDDEALRPLLAKAVLDSLTPEKREQLITAAIAAQFKPDPSSYNKKSFLENAFAQAAENVAREIVREEMAKPEHDKVIRDMVLAAWEKMISDEGRREKAINRMADALADAMSARDR